MSLTIPSSIASLPASIQAHAHGHKKGSQVDLASQLDPASDSATTPAAKTPVGSTQNVLSRLFGFVAQTLGIPLPAAAAPVTPNAGSTVASSPAAASKINVTA